MKKIMIYAYTYANLGDDLFIKTLCDRYPDTTFVLHAPRIYKEKLAYIKNLTVIPSDHLFIRLMNYACRTFNIPFMTQQLIASRCDGAVHIGGSLFIQGEAWEEQFELTKALHQSNKPFFLIGANFGPYDDPDFYAAHRRIFKQYTDICFRERHTYNLFKDLENVRVADDVIFHFANKRMLNDGEHTVCLTETMQEKSVQNKSVAISVIKPSTRPHLAAYDDLYYEKMAEVSLHFIKKGFDVTLMSFCEYEGDSEAIQQIKRRIPKNMQRRLLSHYYQLNMGAALAIIAQATYVIATRFHAMILGWIYDKPVYPIAYSEKITNVLNDIEFHGNYTDFKGLEKISAQDVHQSMESNVVEISEQINNAEKQFEKLDQFLA